MAYTTPTPYWESTGLPSDTYTAAKELSLFINGRHPTQTNAAPWQIIDCYDGTTREQPADGDSDNLTAGNKWRADAATNPPQNSYIVWQAPGGGDVAARFQVYMEMTTFTGVFFGVFMLNDWVPGAGTDATPDIPATSLGAPAFAGGVDLTISNHNDYVWHCVMDEGTMIIGAYPTVAGFPEHFYLGDLKPENDVSLDPRPFVVSKDPDNSGWGGTYYYISNVDDTTAVICGDDVALEGGMVDAQDQDAGWSARPLSEVGCYSNATGHRHRKGKFRLCAAISRHAKTVNADRVTCGEGATDYTYEVTGRVGTSAPQIVTRYGGTAALDSHIEIVTRTIPELLEPTS